MANFDTWLSALNDVVQIIAVVITVILAWRGLYTWRHEMVGRKRAELAEEMLSKFYEAQANLQKIRGEYTLEGEADTRQRDLSESDNLRNLRDRYFGPIARIYAQSPFWNDFLSSRFRVMARFGNEAGRLISELNGIKNKVHLASDALIRNARQYEIGADGKAQLKAQRDKWEQVIGWGDPDNDEMGAKINKIVEQAEALFSKAIDGRERKHP